MANTVNDVMNVIASPDYGIKNIAGTTQEILAIMQGAHNSQNNIHNIVDDVKNLLQTLVDTTTEKKSIEVRDKSSKINHKRIEKILDETKGIRKAIINLEKAFNKSLKGYNVGVAKLSDKASQRVASAMIKNIKKQNGGIDHLVSAFTKLKNVSLIDIILGNKKLKKISELFKDAKKNLKIKDEDLNVIIKLINATPKIIKTLSKVNWRINRIIKNKTIKNISNILVGKNSILSISLLLQKNEKVFNKATKVAKNINELILSLNKAMKNLFFASLWAKLIPDGIKNIEFAINKLVPLSKKLTKNKKEINSGVKAAKKITTLIGNLLIASILLTITAISGGPALLGAKLLYKIVNQLIPITKKLSKNNKHISKAIGSSIKLVAFTGLMAVSSLFLATIAVTGVPALLGSILMLGIVTICTLTFKMLSKATKNVLIGSLTMVLMSASLLLFGIALKKITDATKGVSFKQVGIIASLTILLGGTIALLGTPVVAPLVALGSVVMLAMGLSLIPFAKSLNTITKATQGLKMKHILLITGSMLALAAGISSMALLLIPVTLGSLTLNAITLPLQKFVKIIKIIKDIGDVPTKLVYQVLNAMKAIGNFFKSNTLKPKVIKQAKRYKKMMIPFGNTIKHLAKLKELGTIPMKLVYQTLNAMSAISNYYVDNPISRRVIKQAERYKKMMLPFKNTIKYLIKLKELGTLPMTLVNQTLNAMRTISNYFIDNPIKRKTIKQARRYKKMLKPFGDTIKYFSKLNSLGIIPMKLVLQTLNAMDAIANYYVDNPIKSKTIKQARRYEKMLKPFGDTIQYLSKLNSLGIIPMKLIYQTLNVISLISDFYQNKKLSIFKGVGSRNRATMISGIISSFGKAVDSLKVLKDLNGIPSSAVENITDAISNITSFYNNVSFSDHTDKKSKLIKLVVDEFTNMAVAIQDKFTNLKVVNSIAVKSITSACNAIIRFYKTKIFVTSKKIQLMNDAIRLFTENVSYLKGGIQGFTRSEYNSVNFAVKSMKQILKFLKRNSLNNAQKKQAQENMAILKDVAFVMSNISKINPLNISHVGDAMTNALSGVRSIDISQVEAVTNMFNAFNGINKSESIINKFTESVKEFTETCKDLMDAMGNNTDAINNMDSFGNRASGYIFDNTNEKSTNFVKGDSNNNTNTQTNGIRIANVDEIARTIAEKINGVLSVDMPDTQVQLLINGSGGNEWIITRY